MEHQASVYQFKDNLHVLINIVEEREREEVHSVFNNIIVVET